MRWNPFRREKRESQDYTYTIIAGQESANANAVRVAETAAMETVAGALSRALAGAEVEGDAFGWITPETLALAGRTIIRTGETVFLLTARGLVPVESLYWEGELAEHESDWTGVVTTFGPSHNRTRRVPRDRLIVVRWGNTPGRPYEGKGPSQFATLAARASAESERAAGDDQASPVANLVPVPNSVNDQDGGDNDNLKSLRADVTAAKGAALLVPTTNDGFGEGRGAAPQRDWNPTRLGPNPTAGQVTAADHAFNRMLAACGYPPALANPANAQSMREALRQWHMGTVQPVTRLIESELSRRLDSPIRLKLDTYGLDIAGRAQAFAKLVAGGMELKEAAGISGVLADA